MKVLPVMLLSCLCALTWSCGAEAGDRPADWSGPIAVVEKWDHDFGALFAGARVEGTFVIENRGQRDLELVRSHADCGCTKPSFDRQVVAPGEQALMTVELIAPTIHNATRKRIEVYTNDPYAARLDFGMIMQGMGEASIRPTQFEFDEVVGPEGLSRPLDLQLPPGHQLVGVTPVMKQPSEPTAEAIEIRVADLETGQLELFIKGPREKLLLRDYVQFQIIAKRADGQEVRLQPQGLQLQGELRPLWQFEPGLLDFGWVGLGQESERKVRLLRNGEPALARPIDNDPELAMVPTAIPGEFLVRLKTQSTGSLRRRLTVETEPGERISLAVLAWKKD